MRISILQGFFLPVPTLRGGAVEKLWFRMGQEFAARGHQVTHVSRQCDGLSARETIGGVSHVRIRGYDHAASNRINLRHDLLFSWRARRALPAADIVVTNTFWGPVVLPRRAGRIYVDVQRMPRGQIRLYGRAARLRANSSAVRQAIMDELPGAAPRIRVIPNALPRPATTPVAWSAKRNRVLYVGRLHREKGIELLLEAWRRVLERGALPGWSLALLGPGSVPQGGSGDDWVCELQRRYVLPGIEWREPIFDDARLAREYEQARVFVYPSLAEKGETFGSAVLEAMEWGAIPVVSNLACFRDFVQHGANGFCFDHRAAESADRLATALLNAASSAGQSLAPETLRVRETHSPAAIAAQFLADFESLR